jgi:uncharacterized protein
MFLSILLFAGTMLISLLATWRVKSAFAKYSQVPATSGFSGAEAAEQILQASGIHDVEVIAQDELLGDHYDPMNKRLVLSQDNFYGRSAAALGIAAHECGHAIQHQQAYFPLQLRSAAVGLTQFSSSLMYLPFILMFMGILAPHTGYMFMAVAAMIIMAFNLITLPVEYDASARAKRILPQLGIINGPAESNAVSSVLNAAALTYVAAFLVSMVNVLYYLALARGGDRR